VAGAGRVPLDDLAVGSAAESTAADTALVTFSLAMSGNCSFTGGDVEIELRGEPRKVPDAVAVAVGERLDVELIEDGVLIPERASGSRSRHRCLVGRVEA
jgi:allophanate hydrolase subunit 2